MVLVGFRPYMELEDPLRCTLWQCIYAESWISRTWGADGVCISAGLVVTRQNIYDFFIYKAEIIWNNTWRWLGARRVSKLILWPRMCLNLSARPTIVCIPPPSFIQGANCRNYFGFCGFYWICFCRVREIRTMISSISCCAFCLAYLREPRYWCCISFVHDCTTLLPVHVDWALLGCFT